MVIESTKSHIKIILNSLNFILRFRIVMSLDEETKMIDEKGRCIWKMQLSDQALPNLQSNIGNSRSEGEMIIYG